MVKGSGLERLLPRLHRCNTIIHRKKTNMQKQRNKYKAQMQQYLLRRNEKQHTHKKAAALLAQMQHNYSQKNTRKKLCKIKHRTKQNFSLKLAFFFFRIFTLIPTKAIYQVAVNFLLAHPLYNFFIPATWKGLKLFAFYILPTYIYISAVFDIFTHRYVRNEESAVKKYKCMWF